MIKNCFFCLLISNLFFPLIAQGITFKNQSLTERYTHYYLAGSQRIDEVHTITLMGIGSGYAAHPDFRKVPLDFYIAHLWEVWRYGAFRLGGEYLTDLNDASIADIAVGFTTYPFTYGTTPYIGIEAGYGYGQITSDSDFGFTITAETGAFAIRVSNLLLAISVRVTYNTALISGKRPVISLLRIGILI
jgi:hypothetical protein